jgi:hypothetical protein
MFALELASGEVCTVLAEWSLPASDTWAVFPTERKASAKARAFMRFVETGLRWPIQSVIALIRQVSIGSTLGRREMLDCWRGRR